MASGDDLRALDTKTLVARIEAAQARAFARYAQAADRADAETDAALAATHYAQAEVDCAPWIDEARALNAERVRRLRLRARRWWIVTGVIVVAGVVAVLFLRR